MKVKGLDAPRYVEVTTYWEKRKCFIFPKLMDNGSWVLPGSYYHELKYPGFRKRYNEKDFFLLCVTGEIDPLEPHVSLFAEYLN